MSLFVPNNGKFPRGDHEALVKAATGKKSAIEFGPGFSTFALIEAGCERIVSYENDLPYANEMLEWFDKFPQVSIRRYWNEAPVARVGDQEEKFDIGFVDGPRGYFPHWQFLEGQEDCSRLNTMLAALARAPIVYLHDAFRPRERATLGRLNAMGHKVTLLPPRMACVS